MLMVDTIYVIVVLAVLGVAMGSFAGALIWRLHKQQEIEDAASSKKQPTKQATDDRYSIVRGRSMCSHCEHPLAPKDLIPLYSWLSLRGRCRYCKRPIGRQELILELVMPVLFIISYLAWPDPLIMTWYQWVNFGLWLLYVVLLVVLFVYDLRWYLLPDRIVWPLVGLAVLNIIVQFVGAGQYELWPQTLQAALYGLLPISGLYFLIYTVSRGRMVGFGDVKLGLFMGLVLGWEKAFLTLFLANLLGGLIVAPLLLTGKLKRNSRVPFGPMLIAAFFIAGLWGDRIINWYVMLRWGI